MQIVLKDCARCRTIKAFWLRNTREEGFYCKCGINRKMRNYYGADYVDYFISLIRDPLTVEGLLNLAAKEHMHIEPGELHRKLQAYNLDHLTEPELHEMVMLVLASDDVFRVRKELARFTDIEQMLHAIAKYNPRIDIPGLREYLGGLGLPLSEEAVIEMEKAIEHRFYHFEIEHVTEW